MSETYIRSLQAMSHEEIGAQMRSAERQMGCRLIDVAPWLDWKDWDRASIFSQDGNRIRLVLLLASKPGSGAFTRLVAKITEAGLIPVIAEPTGNLVDWCLRHEFRSCSVGEGTLRHIVWYPRICDVGNKIGAFNYPAVL